jgi:rhomboid family GlyGly-CTERM serine protease
MRSLLRQILAVKKLPWMFLAIALAAAIIQLNGAWRDLLVYNRGAITHGEWWRIWTGHLIHFGWPHFIADVGLFVILGRLLEWQHPWLSRIAIVSMPAVISAAVYWFDPAMTRYGGLSALNVGLLLFLACQGWQRSWIDWFWPVVLAIYLGEIVLEATKGHGHGGGMIQFDEPSVRVATVAHIAGSLWGVLAWLGTYWMGSRARTAVGATPPPASP